MKHFRRGPKFILLFSVMLCSIYSHAQVKILFDNVKGETSGTTADWTIDADLDNINWGTAGTAYTCGTCTHSDPQQVPTPAQSTITAASPETTWTGALSNWGIDLVNQGYIVESLPYTGAITYGSSTNAQDLSHYKVFIMCEPNTHLTTAEKTALVSFVQNGGGLYMISDHNGSDRNFDGWDSPHIWMDFANSTSNVFGVIADTVDISPTVTTLPSLPNDSCLHGPMGTVTGIKYHSGTTFTIYPAVNPYVKGIAYSSGTTGNTNVLAGHSRYGSGKIAFLGDSSPCDDGTGNPNSTLTNSYTADLSGSHRKLLVNTTIWLATTDSTPPAGALTLSPSGSASVCAGTPITLTAAGASSYLWSPGGSTSASITVSPTTNTTYTVTGMVNGASQTQTVTVTVNNKPTPLFTSSFTGSALSVTNQSINATSSVWNFGDGTAQVSGTSPAAHTYANAGTYTVMLITTNNCGTDTVTHSVTLSALALTPSSNTTICAGQPVTLTASGASSYLWSPGGSTATSITVSPTTTTTYTVTGMVNSVAQTKSVTITVNHKPTPLFNTSITGMVLTVTNQSTNAASSIWNFGDGTSQVSGTSPSPHTYTANGTYTIMLITTNSCGTDTATHSITLNGLSLSPNGNTSVCQGDSITLTASGASSYQWSPGGSTAASITVSPAMTTSYTVTGIINSVPQTQTVIVSVDSLPVAAFTAAAAANVVTVTDQSQNASSYQWFFGDGSSVVTGGSPTPHTYTANATYNILLVTSNNCGIDSTTRQVVISVLGFTDLQEMPTRIYQTSANEIKIQYASDNEDRDIFIYNAAGQIVMQRAAENFQATEIISLNILPNGFYIIRAGNSIKRFIK